MNIIIPCDPVGMPRAKVSTRGGFARAYVDAKHPCHELKQKIRLAYINAGGELLDGPVEVMIIATFGRPKSHSKKRRLAVEYHTKKPDCDNVAKLVLDALNEIAYNDDSQVSRLTVIKYYDSSGREKGLEIRVKGLTDEF